MMLVFASVAVALIVFIVYALDRRAKEEAIEWADALKLSLFGGILTSGIVFASTTDPSAIPQVVAEGGAVVAEGVQAVAQDMFVGTPAF